MRLGAPSVQMAVAGLGPDGGAGTEFWVCDDCEGWGSFGLVHEEWDDALTARLARGTARRPPI